MYLLSTPNGRQILQEISEGGIEKLEDYINVDELVNLKENLSKQFEEDVVEQIEQEAEAQFSPHTPKRRRLFKGIKRK